MTTLATNHRNKLERVITEAREAAETGARASLEAFAVHHHEPYGHMTPDDRKLRNRLRAHGRQLGDSYDSKKGTQAIDHLVNECAYEHWHRMLFARFLAENDLLIEPDMGVAISLEECEELAKEQKIDPWVLASRYAQQMLPQIFRPDDPLLQVTFAREHLLKLERLLESLEPEVFTASDAIGWVYQFWQSKKKEEVNRSERKIGTDELPAVTQLFTEPYMVNFLIHNTLGAWYAGKVFAANPDLARNAENEEALRNALALPGAIWDYLRFIKGDDGIWQPAAGTFDGWPKKAAELKVLDPCCGSGHFLVAVFLYLVALRMAEEGLSARDACNAVLRDNIFGLEIDERCTQIAAFAIALAAWSYPAAGGFRPLSEFHIACTGIGPQANEEQWVNLAEQAGMPTQADEHERVKNGLLNLHRLFSQAPTLGSLINLTNFAADIFSADYEALRPYLKAILKGEKSDDEQREKTIAAAGMVKAAELLAYEYTLVITNVPYLGRGKQNETLQAFCDRNHNLAKADLSTCFIDRAIKFLAKSGAIAVVSPQNWLFLSTYKSFRKMLLQTCAWEYVTRLGSNAFQDMNWWHATTSLLILTSHEPMPDHTLHGLDVSLHKDQAKKALLLKGCDVDDERSIIQSSSQEDIKKDPDARIVFRESRIKHQLSDFAVPHTGLQTGDNYHYTFVFWEIPSLTEEWEYFHRTTETTSHYGGCFQILRWEQGKGSLADEPGNRIAGLNCSGLNGVLVHRMNRLPVTLFIGDMFDQNGAVILPKEERNLIAIWCFLSSDQYHEEVRRLDTKTGVTPKTLADVPFDVDHWSIVAEKMYPSGLPEPASDDPTQWLFHGRPEESTMPLLVAVARLLGYRWPAELDTKMELADEQRQLVEKCESLLRFADDDGIVCIPSIRGEDAAQERLRELLAAAYGTDWSPAKERELVTAAQAHDLDDWLRNYFFEQHCQLFHHRPFVWHIWDGRKRDGFHALVNYHKLAEAGGKGRQLLEKLTYGYLGDWITLQKDGVKQGIGGADDRLAAALELEKRLKAILDGEPPFDIFIRWKPIEQQPIGWEPDINDGVRLNIRPFMADDIPGGKRGAGILRWKPNIKWEKDRGKDVASAPWFDLGPQYGGHPGDRINDHHLTCEEKRKAREAMEKNKEKKA
ncbi:MAG TPA: restriction endonuclease subunit M [Syntrophaceae bacterium]|nr:restriction endonuclease subunit M [Syntrophaceae bacterium]